MLEVLVVVSVIERTVAVTATSSATAAMLLRLHGDNWRRNNSGILNKANHSQPCCFTR